MAGADRAMALVSVVQVTLFTRLSRGSQIIDSQGVSFVHARPDTASSTPLGREEKSSPWGLPEGKEI